MLVRVAKQINKLGIILMVALIIHISIVHGSNNVRASQNLKSTTTFKPIFFSHSLKVNLCKFTSQSVKGAFAL